MLTPLEGSESHNRSKGKKGKKEEKQFQKCSRKTLMWAVRGKRAN